MTVLSVLGWYSLFAVTTAIVAWLFLVNPALALTKGQNTDFETSPIFSRVIMFILLIIMAPALVPVLAIDAYSQAFIDGLALGIIKPE